MVMQLSFVDTNPRFDSHASWLAYLVKSLRYSASQLSDVPNSEAIAVYRDGKQRECLAVIAARGSNYKSTLSRLRQLAHQLAAEFVAIGSPEDFDLFQADVYGTSPAPVKRLPTWIPSLSRNTLIPREHVLLPFRSDDQLRKAVAVCHDELYIDSANDPAAAFDLLSLIIAAKVMDEQNDDCPVYEFATIVGEDESLAAKRLYQLLKRAQSWLAGSDLADEDIRDIPRLRPMVVRTLYRELEDYSLTLTGASPAGTDMLGVVYEQLVGSTFRGELGSYFTPRTIADFMVRLLDIRHGRVCDPSCGSGGLLIAAQRRARAEGVDMAALDLFGNDLNPRMVEAARVNFLVHQLDPTHVLHGDGLNFEHMLNRWFGSNGNSDDDMPLWDRVPGPFDYVLANPPFAGYEKNPQLLRHFATARRDNGKLRSLNKTLPFLELIVALLKNGGHAGIVLPTSVLNAEDESFVRFRALLLKHVELEAIIGLPEKAFVHSGCGIHGALLFFKRCAQPRENYDVFVGWADQLGYDRLGKPTRTSSFPRIVERFHQDNWTEADRVPLRDLIAHRRWDPTWLRTASKISVGDRDLYVPLSELVEVRNAKWSRKQIHDDAEYCFFEVNDTDLKTGCILRTHTISGFELVKKGRIRNQVRSGDVLLPNHRDSLMAAGAANGRSVVVVDADFDGVLTTDRFMVLRPKIDLALLVAILNSRGVRRQLVAQSRGAASLDIRVNSLSNVLVPKPILASDKVMAIQGLSREIAALRQRLQDATCELMNTVECEFDSDAPIRPSAAFL